MKSNILYSVAEKVSLRPNKLVCYNEILKFDTINQCVINRVHNCSGGVQLKKFHNFEISKNATREISNKISWLWAMARKKQITTLSGKQISNFKMSFFTLTLPSTQVHPTAEITKTAFNQFLTEMRKSYKLTNYVWRLEFQKNGNVHYHLATDVYIDYYIMLKVWNRCINKLGYVDRYAVKMKSISLLDYRNLNEFNKKADFKVISERYANNVKNGWKVPPSVDVKSCTSGKAIASYIAKYFGKKDKSGCKCNPLDNEQNSFSLRLWYASTSLSKLKTITEYKEACAEDLQNMLKGMQDVKEIICDYCIIYYFELLKLPFYMQRYFRDVFDHHANSVGYYPSQ